MFSFRGEGEVVKWLTFYFLLDFEGRKPQFGQQEVEESMHARSNLASFTNADSGIGGKTSRDDWSVWRRAVAQNRYF